MTTCKRTLISGMLAAVVWAITLPVQGQSNTDPVDVLESGVISVEHNGLERSFPYRFHRPEDVPEAQKLPLVVFLHGAGERGEDNLRQIPTLP